MVDLARLGRKFMCFQCDTRFYDMNRPEPTCPKCGANQKLAPKEEPVAPVDVVTTHHDDDLAEEEAIEDEDSAPDLDDEDSPESIEEPLEDEEDVDDE